MTDEATDPLAPEIVRSLRDDGFAIVEGFVANAEIRALSAAYDRVLSAGEEPDKRVGRTTTRLHDLVTRDAVFDGLYIDPLLLAACSAVIAQPFKLSNLLARSVHPGANAQDLHVDVVAGQDGRPMLGFILMVDEFTEENGATRFVPGSHRESGGLAVAATGRPGTVVVYDGSVLHGHGSNGTKRPRRSIQGAYIPRTATAFPFEARMTPELLARLTPLARDLLGLR